MRVNIWIRVAYLLSDLEKRNITALLLLWFVSPVVGLFLFWDNRRNNPEEVRVSFLSNFRVSTNKGIFTFFVSTLTQRPKNGAMRLLEGGRLFF